MNTDDTQQEKSLGQIAFEIRWANEPNMLWEGRDASVRLHWEKLASAVLLAHSQRHSKAAEGGQLVFDLVSHLNRQRDFSLNTFGPGPRTKGVLADLRTELLEIEKTPADLTEWIDVVLLALDGAWRSGYEPLDIATALAAKQAKNESRKWPDWRTAPSDKAIEHDRGEDVSTPDSEPEVRWEWFTGKEAIKRGYTKQEGDEVWVEVDWQDITWHKLRLEGLQAPWNVDHYYRRPVPAADSGEKLIYEQLERSNAFWEQEAQRHCRNELFYHDLVTQIGEPFGIVAKTSDDGSIQQDVLALKVPELVEALRQEHSSLQAQVEALQISITQLEAEVTNERNLFTAETARASKAETDFSEIKMSEARAIASEKVRADRAESLSAQRYQECAEAHHEIDTLRTANVRLEKECDEANKQTEVWRKELQSRLSQHWGDLLTRKQVCDAYKAWTDGVWQTLTDLLNAKLAEKLNQHLFPIWTPCAPGSMPTDESADENGDVIWCDLDGNKETSSWNEDDWENPDLLKNMRWWARIPNLPNPTPVAAREDDGECYKAWRKAIQNDLDGTAPLEQWTMAWTAAIASTKESISHKEHCEPSVEDQG